MAFCHTLHEMVIVSSNTGYLLIKCRGYGFGGTYWHILVWYNVHKIVDLYLLIHIPGAPLSHLMEDYVSLVAQRLHIRHTRPVLTSCAFSCALARCPVHYRSSPVGNTLAELGPRTRMLFTYTFLFCSVSLHVTITV